MLILDTNVVIEYVQAVPRIVTWIETERNQRTLFAISTVSVVEMLSYPNSSTEETTALEQWLGFRLVLDVDLPIGRAAATLRKRYQLQTVDSIIAATAIVHHGTLVSSDRAFRKISELELIVP